jgi:hypothetical protein
LAKSALLMSMRLYIGTLTEPCAWPSSYWSGRRTSISTHLPAGNFAGEVAGKRLPESLQKRGAAWHNKGRMKCQLLLQY